mgnify:FL=1
MPRWLDAIRERLVDGRAAARRTAGERAWLIANGRDFPVTVLDRSESGAMLSIDGTLREGTKVKLVLLDHSELNGQVRWAREGRMGLLFDGTDGAQLGTLGTP